MILEYPFPQWDKKKLHSHHHSMGDCRIMVVGRKQKREGRERKGRYDAGDENGEQNGM